MKFYRNNDIDIDGLMEYIKAPYFPTGGTIYGYEGVKNAFLEGKGRIVMRAKAMIEEIRENRILKPKNVQNLLVISLKEITWFGQIARKYANITINPPT